MRPRDAEARRARGRTRRGRGGSTRHSGPGPTRDIPGVGRAAPAGPAGSDSEPGLVPSSAVAATKPRSTPALRAPARQRHPATAGRTGPAPSRLDTRGRGRRRRRRGAGFAENKQPTETPRAARRPAGDGDGGGAGRGGGDGSVLGQRGTLGRKGASAGLYRMVRAAALEHRSLFPVTRTQARTHGTHGARTSQAHTLCPNTPRALFYPFKELNASERILCAIDTCRKRGKIGWIMDGRRFVTLTESFRLRFHDIHL